MGPLTIMLQSRVRIRPFPAHGKPGRAAEVHKYRTSLKYVGKKELVSLPATTRAGNYSCRNEENSLRPTVQ
jgi:hypothetical protein